MFLIENKIRNELNGVTEVAKNEDLILIPQMCKSS